MYVLDDDQGLFDSTVWLLESVWFQLRELQVARLCVKRGLLLPLVRRYTTCEIAGQREVSATTHGLYRSRVITRTPAASLPERVGIAIAARLLDPLHLR